MLILITIQHLNRIIKCTHELKFASWNLLQAGTEQTRSHFLVSHWKLRASVAAGTSKVKTLSTLLNLSFFFHCSWANSTRGKPLRTQFETKNVSYLWFVFRILRPCEWEILHFFYECAFSQRCLVSLNVQHECDV